MSSPQPSTASSRRVAKSQRVLACVLCQQRKVKCDRRFPCANCVRASAQCVPATLLPRKRRRKLPEGEAKLLDRIRHYEGMLRTHNVEFEPYKIEAAIDTSARQKPGEDESIEDDTGPKPTTKRSGTSGTVDHHESSRYEDFRSAVDRWFEDTESDDDATPAYADSAEGKEAHTSQNTTLRRYWKNRSDNYNHILFGFRQLNLELSVMHPNQVQIFRLWQIYLDNVNPLLKVTHTPTLQAQIIDAAANVSDIDSDLQALMFSIYSVAVMTLSEQQCLSQFGTPRNDLLAGYQMACQQALLNCDFLSTDNRNCLTALFLYLISVRPDADPKAVASMLGIAVRIAERMGIWNEAANVKCDVVSAELRRRLWWSLINFDRRISEVAGFRLKVTDAAGCKPPLNVNDFDLRGEMQTAPEAHKTPTEALFVVVRSELAERILEFMVQPISDPVTSEGKIQSLLVDVEQDLEEHYFRFCNPENPLHFMTIWSMQVVLSKVRLMLRYSMRAMHTEGPSQRDRAFKDALKALEADTHLISSPLTKGFSWYLNMYFPFPAWIFLVQDLKERPIGEHADQAWRIMCDNFEARVNDMYKPDDSVVKTFAKRILQVWDIREVALSAQSGGAPVEVPSIIGELRRLLAQSPSSNTTPRAMTTMEVGEQQLHGNNAAAMSSTTIGSEGLPTPLDFDTTAAAMQFTNAGLPGDAAVKSATGTDFFSNPNVFGHQNMEFTPMGSMNWNMAFWNQMNTPGWW